MTNTQKLERAIVTALIKECAAAGFVPVTVYQDGDYEPDLSSIEGPDQPTPVALSTEAAIDAVFAVDVSTLHFAPADNLGAWGNRGVMLVCGNGEDIISDWHCGNEAFNSAVARVASSYVVEIKGLR